MRTLGVTVVSFKRDEDSPWEEGTAIAKAPGLADLLGITDAKGQTVPDIWDYRIQRPEFAGRGEPLMRTLGITIIGIVVVLWMVSQYSDFKAGAVELLHDMIGDR